ncbi:hypothetical protein TM7_0446 [candidate division TM7 genomosp. GTL1]|nr:hypothetical protein TM7_0446 [candidate division TM7 genomosp. GTL1]
MKKDVIYIDIEDDITSIIEKVKAAGANIVALVPPKRAGVLQSVVNLKLLQKAAGDGDKRIVLITSDHSLTALAAGVKIPVARNLQSKPEIAPIAALEVDDEDIINGDDLPVGDLQKTAPKTAADLEDAKADKALAALQNQETPTPPKKPTDSKNKKTPRGMKVPDFDRFRKRLLIGSLIGLVVVIFLVWAIVYAPRATVTITAKATRTPIEVPLTLTPGGQTKIDDNVFKPVTEEIKKTQTVDFSATGQKEVGEKASGTMKLTNSSDSNSVTVAAGTRFSSSDGKVFVSNSSVTVPGASVSGGQIVGGTANVGVVAEEIGSEYNLSAQDYTSSDGSVATSGGQMTGGSKKTIQIVTAGDVAKAQQQVKEQDDDSIKADLEKKFNTDDVVIVQESFTTSTGQPVSEPAVDQEATTAKLTVETTYRLYGLKRGEVKKLLDNFLDDEIEGRDDQQIYDNGENKLAFESFNNTSVTLSTTGYTGPKIDQKRLAKEIEGKRYGEIQQMVESVRGVDNVHTDFWPFWVTSAPSSDKITIKFVVSNKSNE